MRLKVATAALAGTLVAVVGAPHPGRHTVTPTKAAAAADLARLPLAFEQNVGQADHATRYLTRQNGYDLLIGPTGSRMVLTRGKRASVLAFHTVGSSPHATVAAGAPLPGRVNYFQGRGSWHTDIATYRRVDVHGVYPGIDLSYAGKRDRVEYTFTVAAGADPAAIRLGVHGASTLRLDAGGDLVARTPAGSVVEHAPVAYQTVDGRRRAVRSAFALHGSTVSFTLADYDRSAPVVIDPVLTYSTYVGGDNGNSQVYGVAVTAGGDIVVTGSTTSASFPSTESGSFTNGVDTFVMELDPSGSSVVYSTYIGGDARDQATAVALDSAGNAYVTGSTDSNNYPLQAAAPTTNDTNTKFGQNLDAFVTELNAAGDALVYSTIVGGSGNDESDAIAVGADGAAYITGLTTSTANFPVTPGAYQQTASKWSAFVTKLQPAGSDPERIDWSTYLGGSVANRTLTWSVPSAEWGLSEGLAIAVDGSGNAYVGGVTLARDFPTTTGAYSTENLAGTVGFVSKLAAGGSTLAWSTFVGGTPTSTDQSQVTGLALAGSTVVAVGSTNAADFPTTANALQTAYGGSASDAFVAELKPATKGSGQLAYSTYLGGSDRDAAEAVAADTAGNVYVTGQTASGDFPTANAFSSGNGAGVMNAFVTRLQPSKAGSAGLIWSSYLGGGGDSGLGIALDPSGGVFVAGQTASSSFPTVNQFATAPSSFAQTGFLARIVNATSHVLSVSPATGSAGDTVTINGAGFLPATAVKFGGVSAGAAGVAFTVDTDSQITATVPALAVDGKVTVSTPDGPSNGVAFDVVPVIDSFTPTHGTPGQVVDITGTSLVKPTALRLNGLKLAVRTVTAGTELSFVVPAAASSGPIAITTANGTVDTGVDTFTVDPSITGFSPTAATGGRPVKIVGTGLAGATDVSFTTDVGWTSATIVSDTANAIVATVPDDATLGPIQVTTPAGVVTSTPSFKALPTVQALSPADGVAGGTATIDGTNLLDASTVTLGTSTAAITSDTATEIQATIPGPPFSSGRAKVTTPSGSSTSKSTFAISSLKSFSPLKAVAGATLTISGQGLGSTTFVDFAGDHGVTPASVSATAVKVTVPATAQTGTITVHTASTALTTAAQFKPLPKITGYDQASYQEGDAVTVEGTNLFGGTFALGGTTLTDSGGSDATHFATTVPTGAVTASVTVTTDAGTATGAKLLVRPTIAPLSVSDGTAGTVLTLGGATFTGTSSVLFAGIAGPAKSAAKFTIVSPTQLDVTVPVSAVTGAIAVKNAGGTTDSATFTVDPEITSFSPTSGAAGTKVTVRGSGFAPGEQASVGSIDATTVTVASSTSLTLVVPPGAATGVIRAWSDPSHKAQSATPFTVTFSATQLEQAVAPAGSRITIDGTGLTGVTSVHFNDAGSAVAVAPSSIASDGSSLTVTVPSTGTVDGVVGVYKSATSHTTVPGTFTRLTLDAPHTIAAPGDTLTLNGSGFTTGAFVEFLNGWTFAGAPSPSSVNGAGTVLTVTVPLGFTGGEVQIVPPAGVSYLVEQPLLGLSTWSAHVGDSVTVTANGGLNLADAVTVGGVAASVTGATSSSIDFTITSGEDTGAVVVGDASSTADFVVEPEITGLSPDNGPAGTAVTLTGDHLAGVTAASVDGADVTATITGNTADQLTITIPDGDLGGAISVTNANGTANTVYTVTLSITGVSPGDATVGTSTIVIAGYGFTGATNVAFNGTAATTYSIDSDTQITATVPSGATTGPITVTTPAGTTSSPSSFTVDP